MKKRTKKDQAIIDKYFDRVLDAAQEYDPMENRMTPAEQATAEMKLEDLLLEIAKKGYERDKAETLGGYRNAKRNADWAEKAGFKP